MCNNTQQVSQWEAIIHELSEFFQVCFYEDWNKEIITCENCEIDYPNHKIFFIISNKKKCKKCLGKGDFINQHTIKLFSHYIPTGIKYCTGCSKLLPADSDHFTLNGDKFHSRCKLCRGFKSYGESLIGINSKLSKEGKKKCKYCYEIKGINQFPRVRNTQVVTAEYCIDCVPIFKDKERMRRQRNDNIEKKSDYDKEYYKLNRVKRLNYRSEWKKTDRGREVSSLLEHKRQAQKKDLLCDLTTEQWEESLSYFNNCCAYCELSEEEHILTYGKVLSKEHIIPITKDGVFSDYNIIPSCLPCNSRKNNRDLETFFEKEDTFTLERYVRVIDYLLKKF